MKNIKAKSKLYIAGKITGDPAALSKFLRYEHFYYKQDYDVQNPMSLCRQRWSWLRCMCKCIYTLAQCQKVCFMPDWTDSRGARIEMATAIILRKQIEMAKQLN